jgi:hypothetical protein
LANAVCENNRCLLNSGSVKAKVGDTYNCHCALKELTDEDRKTFIAYEISLLKLMKVKG